MSETTHLDCICDNPTHHIRFMYDEWPGDDMPDLTVDVRLNRYPVGLKGLPSRRRLAVKYVLGLGVAKDAYYDTFGLDMSRPSRSEI